MNSFYSHDELSALGFESIGHDVLISRYARIYNPSTMKIGNNVRIDDFCILSGNIEIGDNVHISAYVALYGKAGIEIHDYAGISAQTILYSETDDFSGKYLVGPMHPFSKRKIQQGKIVVGKYAQIGSSCVVFPLVEIGEGAAVGAMSLVRESLEPWSINFGIPARYIKPRSKAMLELIKND